MTPIRSSTPGKSIVRTFGNTYLVGEALSFPSIVVAVVAFRVVVSDFSFLSCDCMPDSTE